MNTVVNLQHGPEHGPEHKHTSAPTTPVAPTPNGPDIDIGELAAEHATPSGAPRVERSRGARVTPSAAAAAQAKPGQHSAFVPLVLGGVALLGSMAFQSYQLLGDRQALQAAHAGQQQTVDNAGKLRASLDALAADTQRMADAGNTSARLLVEELKKRGVTINAAAAGAAAPR